MTTNGRSNVTMDDVARAAGVSRTTVSFVLSNRPTANIPTATRRKIWAAVEQLGYRPNAAAQALARQKSQLIGVITDIATSPFAGDAIAGAQQRSWEHNKVLLIASSTGDAEQQASIVGSMLEHRVEGILYATSYHREVTLPVSIREVPVVLINCFDSETVFTTVLPDEEQGGTLATQTLIEHGHRQIGLINLDPRAPAAIGRRYGYEKALAQAGINVDESLIRYGDADPESGYDCARSLLDLPEPPTALFCATDRMAMGAYDAIKERGLRVGADVAVVGFDNQEVIAPHLRPSLSTVALPFAAMGIAAIDALIDLGNGGTALSRVLSCPLVARDSHR